MPSGIACGRGRCRARGRSGSWRRRRRRRSGRRTVSTAPGVVAAGPSRRRRRRPRRPASSASAAGHSVAPAFTARDGDHLVEVAAAHDISVRREVGVLGPRQLERHSVADRPQPVEALEVGERLGETHVVELAHGPRREAVAARLLAREALLLDDQHPVPALGEPVARPRRPTDRRRRRGRRSSVVASACTRTDACARRCTRGRDPRSHDHIGAHANHAARRSRSRMRRSE